MRWEDAYDIRPSTNTRGENTYDVYFKDSDTMLAADIPAKEIDKFLGDMVKMADRVVTQDIDKLFGKEDTTSSVGDKPMVVDYTKKRGYPPFSTKES